MVKHNAHSLSNNKTLINNQRNIYSYEGAAIPHVQVFGAYACLLEDRRHR